MPFLAIDLFQWKPDTAESAVAAIQSILPSFSSIAGVERCHFGQDLGAAAGNYSFGLTVELASQSDLESYECHPKRAELLAAITPYLQNVESIRFDSPTSLDTAFSVRHVVILTFKQDETRSAEQILEIHQEALALKDKIPQIGVFRPGSGVVSGQADLCFVVDFATIDDFKVYAPSDAHQQFIAHYLKPILAKRVACQFAISSA
eukprot:GILI01017936.1.p1 GENE.GILI01017936.1~~GILI01017936.1.p1  ORF type:complete len:218 (+),score=44.16 GILI01017936.1:41-655(+)